MTVNSDVDNIAISILRLKNCENFACKEAKLTSCTLVTTCHIAFVIVEVVAGTYHFFVYGSSFVGFVGSFECLYHNLLLVLSISHRKWSLRPPHCRPKFRSIEEVLHQPNVLTYLNLQVISYQLLLLRFLWAAIALFILWKPFGSEYPLY